jgi:predicted AAA+ superfamily ATPase
LNRELHFPVGRVEFLVIRPASFIEFLDALDETGALEQVKKIPAQNSADGKLLELFDKYAIIGGMPEIVSKYAETRDLTSLRPIDEQLITSYLEDVEKYARNNSLQQVLIHCIRAS